MGKQIGLTVFIIVLVLFLAALLFIPLSKSFPSGYVYNGTGGKLYNFTVDNRYDGVTYHILSFKAGPVGSIVRFNYKVPFEYSPEEVEDIEIPDNLKKKVFNSKGIFITRDPKLGEEADFRDVVAITTVSRILGKEDVNIKPHIYRIPVYSAFTYDDGNDRTVLDCTNSTSVGRVIYLKEGSENKIYYDEDNEECIVMEFDSRNKEENMVRVSTKLVYTVIGIF